LRIFITAYTHQTFKVPFQIRIEALPDSLRTISDHLFKS
jgi:hypothetical protein